MSNQKDKVGYKSPPESAQFKKGKSGNPKGRPKGSKNIATMVKEELNVNLLIQNSGNRKRIPAGRCIIKRHVQKATGGCVKSAQFLFSFLKEDEAKSKHEYEPVIIIDNIPRSDES